jgi:uncharacterized protein with GYD domain
MPKFLFRGSYNPEGARGLLVQGGSARVTATRALAESVGGTVESFMFAFGGHDFYVMADLPDHAAALSIAATVAASGFIANFETIVLVTPEEADAAANLSPQYRPPGR